MHCQRDGPLSVLELTIHAAARTLGDFPELNGFYADGQSLAVYVLCGLDLR